MSEQQNKDSAPMDEVLDALRDLRRAGLGVDVNRTVDKLTEQVSRHVKTMRKGSRDDATKD